MITDHVGKHLWLGSAKIGVLKYVGAQHVEKSTSAGNVCISLAFVVLICQFVVFLFICIAVITDSQKSPPHIEHIMHASIYHASYRICPPLTIFTMYSPCNIYLIRHPVAGSTPNETPTTHIPHPQLPPPRVLLHLTAPPPPPHSLWVPGTCRTWLTWSAGSGSTSRTSVSASISRSAPVCGASVSCSPGCME